MTEIRAFVGHSFVEDDEPVVNAFLKCLDQVKSIHPSFDWVHARAAEPTNLAEKVLSLVADCNTFIGICTRKEYASDEQSYNSRWFDRETLVVPKNELVWKTSDWIVQEIGMAAGRGMSIILLLENGCRRPGGLQGDVEFISFNRDAPERAFGSLIEMIKALGPVAQKSGLAIAASSKDESDDLSESSTYKFEEPTSDWNRDKFESSFVWAHFMGRSEDADLINVAFLNSNLSNSPSVISEWNSFAEIWKLRFDKGGAIDTLKRLHNENPDNAPILANYAAGLEKFEEHVASAEAYLAASERTQDDADIISYLSSSAVQFAKANEKERCIELLEDMKRRFCSNSDLSARIARAIKSSADALGDKLLAIEAMERIIALHPDDYDMRFSLAFAHSDADNEEMALHHYLAIPVSKRSSITWNNLGVAYQNFSAPAEAIQAYRKSAAQGETLAMSNLAYRYMQAGFLKEAKELLDQALETENAHKNVGEAYSALKQIPQDEEETLRRFRDSREQKVGFFRQLAQAICRPSIERIPPMWVGPNCELQCTIQGRRFEAKGQYTSEPNAFSSLLGASTSTEYDLTYEGEIIGERVHGTVERKPKNATSYLGFGGNDYKKSFALIFSENLTVALVMEDVTARSPTYYEIRVSAGTALPAS